jgi:transposase InsO family protein
MMSFGKEAVMPWKVQLMSKPRADLIQSILVEQTPIAQACRSFGVSRKTAYKWLRRAQAPGGCSFQDRSRRPTSSPRKTSKTLEKRIVKLRDDFKWGARKLRAILQQHRNAVPSIRTVHAILHRHQRLAPPPPPRPIPQSFVRPEPNELWQLDFKGPVEIRRQRIHTLSVLDDHSRFLLGLHAATDLTYATTRSVLWVLFAEFGLPEAILCDNAFAARNSGIGLSAFDAWLLQLDIKPVHGRPYHPQTQGKVERFHGTLQRELWPVIRRDSRTHFQSDLDRWRRRYNTLRPHEALDDQTPRRCWRPSLRQRPDKLPEVSYPAGSILRRVGTSGEVCWRGARILAGWGLAGQTVRIEDSEHDVSIYFVRHCVRRLAQAQLRKRRML